MVLIAFHLNHFSIRGSEVAVFDYAHYNEEILNNKSIITIHKNFRERLDYRGRKVHNEDVYNKFKQRFFIVEYSSLVDLETSLKERKVNIFYNLKSGEKDNLLIPNIKNVSHCVFTYNEENAHGDVYIPISPSIVEEKYRDLVPHVPHIVTKIECNDDLRKELNIPLDAIVFGRHGGEETFNIPFVHKVVKEVATDNIYFLFLNTLPFLREYRGKNIIFLKENNDPIFKAKFINTCDAMLHARLEGESFGLAIAEFSIRNKPVITFFPQNNETKAHYHHLEVLKEKGIYYSNEKELKNILIKFSVKGEDFDCYSKLYSPERVMRLFKRYIIDQNVNFISTINPLENISYTCFNTKQIESFSTDFDILKSLRKNTFVDIGAGDGYNTLKMGDNCIAVDEDEFNLLTFNVMQNKSENVACIHSFQDLDSLLENKEVDVIRIKDNELQTLKGGIKTICKNRPYINIPNGMNNPDYSSITNLLNALNYSQFFFSYYPNEKQEELDKNFTIFNEKTVQNESMRIQTLSQKKKRVKMMCNWTTSEDWCQRWSKFAQDETNNTWNDIQLTPEDTDIDYYVVINKPQPHHKFEKEKTIVFRMEPDNETNLRWNDWYSKKEDFMYFLEKSTHRNLSEWWLEKTFNELLEDVESTSSIVKTKCLSTIVSSLYVMEGHKKRIDFIKYMQNNGVEIDVYGMENPFQFKNHKGGLPYHNKNDGILPYKYHFIAENCSLKNYFTEKIIDCILGETLCFYWGCPNVESFIDERAFIKLDFNGKDFKQELVTVNYYIQNNEWEKRIDIIRNEKKKILLHYSFFPRIEGLILTSDLPCFVVNLDRRKDRWESFEKEAKRVDFLPWVGTKGLRYQRYSAVDGNCVNDFSLFKNFYYRKPKKGEIGCALTHLELWKNVDKNTLILEDDVEFVDCFVDQLAMVYRVLPEDFDVVYLGYHLNTEVMKEKGITESFLLKDKNKILISMEEVCKYKTVNHCYGYHGGGTFGYIISPKGAKKLIEKVEEIGFVFPVDYQMLLTEMNSYCVVERLVKSDPSTLGGDTDIQNTETI